MKRSFCGSGQTGQALGLSAIILSRIGVRCGADRLPQPSTAGLAYGRPIGLFGELAAAFVL